MIIVISSCSSGKDDSIPIKPGSRMVTPYNYINNKNLVERFLDVRKLVFSDPRAGLGSRITYTFDLYVRKGRAYGRLLLTHYAEIRKIIMEKKIEWFFLSGGYGIIHALEEARKYQATFNYNIARNKNIPYTKKMWAEVLPLVIDHILKNFDPEFVYVFGSRDYTQFVKETGYYITYDNIRIFESRGSSGVYWLSPIIKDLVQAIIDNNLMAFNGKYKMKIIKQGE